MIIRAETSEGKEVIVLGFVTVPLYSARLVPNTGEIVNHEVRAIVAGERGPSKMQTVLVSQLTYLPS